MLDMNVKSKVPVDRRIGGLENYSSSPSECAIVDRRIGGLEILSNLQLYSNWVDRRIGGLEMFY